MMKQWCLFIVILLLGNIATVPAEASVLVGDMVGQYGVDIIENNDLQSPNIVNLTLTIGASGVNSNSLYYNCGMAERITSVTCQIPEQDHNVSHQLDTTLMYSVLAGYPPQSGRWYLFDTLILVEFGITLQNWSTQVIFSFETETDIVDLSTNSSEFETVTESVSFNYRVQTRYTDTTVPMAVITGVYLSGVGITVVTIAMAAKKIVPD